jgi:hypothetical protein
MIYDWNTEIGEQNIRWHSFIEHVKTNRLHSCIILTRQAGTSEKLPVRHGEYTAGKIRLCSKEGL